MKMSFTKKLLAASVIAAVGSTANAAAPTLGEVLKSSNIDVTGYIDVSYSHLSTDTAGTAATLRAYDSEINSFNLHALDVAISSLPSSGFGGMAEFQFGSDTTFNASAGSANNAENVLQGFLQYATGPFTIMGGKFTTLAGAEVAQAPNNTNFSRSFLYTLAIPVTHTGVRASYALSDSYKFTVGVNNGWDEIIESGRADSTGKTVELGVSATPIKPLSVAASFYMGDEQPAGGSVGTRSLLDVVATYNLTDAMSVVLNIDKGKQEDALTGDADAEWQGVAGYFNYKLNDTWRASARAEQFDDKDGFRTGMVQKLKSVTLTVGYAPAKNAELRAEVRQDASNETFFVEEGTAKKKQNSFGVEAVLKF